MRSIFILFFFLSGLTIQAQKDKSFSSAWSDYPNGNPALTDKDYYQENKGKVLYYISNNDSNLYLDMKVSETLEQNKILKMGMTVWLSMDGRLKKTTGIRYPFGAQFSRIRGGQPSSGNGLSPLQMANMIMLVGFDSTVQKLFPSDNMNNIRGSVRYDNDGNLVYHLTIPFTKFPTAYVKGPVSTGTFTMGIEYGAPPYFSGQGSGSGAAGDASTSTISYGGRGGGGGGRGGASRGGPPGGGGGGYMGGGSTLGGAAGTPVIQPSVIFWIKKIKLAEK